MPPSDDDFDFASLLDPQFGHGPLGRPFHFDAPPRRRKRKGKDPWGFGSDLDPGPRRFQPLSLVPLGLLGPPVSYVLDMPLAAVGGIGLVAAGVVGHALRGERRRTQEKVDVLSVQIRTMMGYDVKIRAKSATELIISYGPTFQDHVIAKRMAIADLINTRLPGRWRLDWDTTRNTVTATRRPEMPRKIALPHGGTGLALGVDEDHRVRYWDHRVTPHLLIAGATGGGKSVTISALILQAAAQGWEVRLVDGKGTTLAGFRHWPGVTMAGFGDADSMAPVLTATEKEVRERYRQVRDHGSDPDEFRPILLVIDEAAEMTTTLAAAWRSDRPKGSGPTHPAIDAWRSVARLGREARVHLVMGIQQASAGFFQGTEARDQFACRYALGPTTEQSADMMFGRTWVGRDVEPRDKGRATLATQGTEVPVEVQSYYAPELRPNGAARDEKDAAEVARWRAEAERAQPPVETRVEPDLIGSGSGPGVSPVSALPGRCYLVEGERFGPLTDLPAIEPDDPDAVWLVSGDEVRLLSRDMTIEEVA